MSADLVEKHKKLSDKLLLMVANSNGTMKLILEETILISSIPKIFSTTPCNLAVDFLANCEIPLDYELRPSIVLQ